MAWIKVPPEHHPLFREALPRDPRVETQLMAKPAKTAKGTKAAKPTKAAAAEAPAKRPAKKK
jgi:hypothetical protein